MSKVIAIPQLNSFIALRRSKPLRNLTHPRQIVSKNAGVFYLPCIVSGYLMRQRGRNAKLILLDVTNQRPGSKFRGRDGWRTGHDSLNNPVVTVLNNGRLMGMMSEKTELTFSSEASYRL